MILNNPIIRLATLVAVALAVAACSNTPDQGSPSGALKNLPQWALSPTSEHGMADSACVQFSGNLNVDRSEAITLANEQLAAQLNRKIAFLAKNFQSKTKSVEGINVGTNFSQTGQQLVQQELSGIKTTQMGVYEVAEREQLCVLVELSQEKVESLYSQLKQTSRATLAASDDSVIFEEFRAYKANKELQSALQGESPQ